MRVKTLLVISILAILQSCGVQQKLSTSYKLSPGMTKPEVESIMGAPIKSDFKQNVEEWHYCSTGMSADEFLALFFYEGKLIEKLNYTVTLADTRGATGSCSKFIKMGNYREPDKVIELRVR
ncbi:MAG: outer membrane protein assembly factor BamE [Sphingobacteriales bacterium]|nr:MAG: outer membrane protein assembly factor BamE [Sphingobacteriales bacterium]